MGLFKKSISRKAKKNKYRVVCYLTLNEATPKKVEVITTAHSRRQAVEQVNSTVKFTAERAYKMK